MTQDSLREDLLLLLHRGDYSLDEGLISLAQRLGLRVFIRYIDRETSRRAALNLNDRPAITLFRSGRNGHMVEVGPTDEGRLRSNERFSIAHEIGHWLAWTQLGVAPIPAFAERSSEYWRHETAINSFASQLLIPDSVVLGWIAGVNERMLVPATMLERWARNAGVSRIVAAGRLAQLRRNFGYLELEFALDPRMPRLMLRVVESSCSADLSLPARMKHIRNDRLVEVLTSSLKGRQYLPSISFDGKRSLTLFSSWRHIGTSVNPLPSELIRNAWVRRLVTTTWAREDTPSPEFDV